MKKPTINSSNVATINIAFGRVSRELKKFQGVCARNHAPLKSLSFRCLDDGNTKTHLVYQRKK